MKLILLRDIPELNRHVGDILEFNPNTDRFDAPSNSYYISNGVGLLIQLKIDVDAKVLQFMETDCPPVQEKIENKEELMPEALREKTIREEVWLRAYEIAFEKGWSQSQSITMAKDCLDKFDEEFPRHKL